MGWKVCFRMPQRASSSNRWLRLRSRKENLKTGLSEASSQSSRRLKENSSRQGFGDRLGVDSLDYPDLRIRRLARAHGISVVTLLPTLARYAEEHQVFLHGFERNLGGGHWNERGHRVAGETLAAALCASLSSETRGPLHSPTTSSRRNRSDVDRISPMVGR